MLNYVPLADDQKTLFDWLRARNAPRGAVSRSELPASLGVTDAQVHQLHDRLESALGTVDLVLTDNRRRMVSSRRRGKRLEMRIHHMFLGCDDVAMGALVGLARGEEGARAVLRDFIRDNREVIHSRVEGVEPNGKHHDLDEALRRAFQTFSAIEAALSDHEFPPDRRTARKPSEIDDVRIGWGRDGKGRRSIRFGSYDFTQQLIRIHPALDADWVPEYFVDFVVYHELLHAAVPARVDSAGRRILHSAEFRALEIRYPRYEEAMVWEREHLARLLNR